MLGPGIYEMDLYGTGSNYGTDFKADILAQMQEYYVIEEKAADYGVALTEEDTAAIAEAAKAFVADNEAETLEQMTADQATVERVLTLMTIRSKVAAAVKAEADVTVTDEEAAQRGFSYITIAKGSGEEAMSEEEIQANKDKLTAVIASVNEGNTIDGAAVEQGLTAYSGNYGEGTDLYYNSALIEAMDAISEGEVTEIVESDTELYLAQVTADLDEEATANRKETLIQTEKTEYFNSILEAWVAEYPMTVVDSVWEQVVFDRSYDIKPE
jgi:foldase protein PrsA